MRAWRAKLAAASVNCIFVFARLMAAQLREYLLRSDYVTYAMTH